MDSNRATVARLEMPKGVYKNIQILRSILFEFIEGNYNRQRLHSSLNYEFSADFEIQWFEKNSEKVQTFKNKNLQKV